MNLTEQPTADFIDATTIDIASDIVDQTFRVTVVTPFLYEAMQQKDKAAAWRKKLEARREADKNVEKSKAQ